MAIGQAEAQRQSPRCRQKHEASQKEEEFLSANQESIAGDELGKGRADGRRLAARLDGELRTTAGGGRADAIALFAVAESGDQ